MIQHNTDIHQAAVGGAVVTYARFSDDHQRPTSIDDQASACRRFAEQRALPAPGRILKDEGVSVKEAIAPNFNRLLDEVA